MPISEIAQQYVNEQQVKIIDLSVVISNESRFLVDKINCDQQYLQKQKNLGNVLAEVRYDSLWLYNRIGPIQYYPNSQDGLPLVEYVELYFDNPVIVQNTFYTIAILHATLINNYDDSCSNSINMAEPITVIDFLDEGFSKLLCNGNWIELYQHPAYSPFYSPTDSMFIPTLYLFPIIDTVTTINTVVDTVA